MKHLYARVVLWLIRPALRLNEEANRGELVVHFAGSQVDSRWVNGISEKTNQTLLRVTDEKARRDFWKTQIAAGMERQVKSGTS